MCLRTEQLWLARATCGVGEAVSMETESRCLLYPYQWGLEELATFDC